jgi:hypothetical protein
MRTHHERSVDRRQTLIQAKSKSTKVAQKISLIFPCQPLGSVHVLEDATGEGGQELRPPV